MRILFGYFSSVFILQEYPIGFEIQVEFGLLSHRMLLLVLLIVRRMQGGQQKTLDRTASSTSMLGSCICRSSEGQELVKNRVEFAYCSVARYSRKFSHVNYDGSFGTESGISLVLGIC